MSAPNGSQRQLPVELIAAACALLAAFVAWKLTH